jgi:hypothetical protein
VVSPIFAVTLLVLSGCGTKHSDAQAKAPWMKVIDDRYDGAIDHRHSCAAVREAIAHLPSHAVTYGHFREDLEAYERKVC